MNSYYMQAHRDSDNKIIGYTVATYDKDTGGLVTSDLFRDEDSAMAYMWCCVRRRDEDRRNADRKKEETS